MKIKNMNINEFKKGIEDIKSQELSSPERNFMSKNLDKYMLSHPVKVTPVRSSWYSNSFVFILSRQGWLVLSVLVLTVISSSSVFFAKNSLPGDTLYSLKVDVIEPLEYSMAVDSVAKTNILLSNLDTRIKEVEALEAGGKLTNLLQNDFENRLKNNTQKILEITNKKRIGENKAFKMEVSSTTDSVSEDVPAVNAMMAIRSISTSTSEEKTQLKRGENKTERIIRSTKESVERIKKSKIPNKRLIDVAEESIRKAEDSIKDIEAYRSYENDD